MVVASILSSESIRVQNLVLESEALTIVRAYCVDYRAPDGGEPIAPRSWNGLGDLETHRQLYSGPDVELRELPNDFEVPQMSPPNSSWIKISREESLMS